MKLSKTPPINQACQGIDFPSSLPSSLSLPAPLHPEASDVSRCKTNVARRVKDDGVTLNSKTSPFLPETCFPPATPGIVGAVKGVQSGLPPPPSFFARLGMEPLSSPTPIHMGVTTFPIMKYSQVSGSLSNDGGQSIASQRVIFPPQTSALSVLTVISAGGRLEGSKRKCDACQTVAVFSSSAWLLFAATFSSSGFM